MSEPSFFATWGPLALGIAAALFLAALVLVLVVVRLLSRRRQAAEGVLAWADRVRREPAAPWAIDGALRRIESSFRLAGVEFPGAVRILLGEIVRVDLATPAIAPPSPWTSTADGRSWSAPMRALLAVPLTESPLREFMTAVVLGVQDGSMVLADLRRIAGPLALGGDRAAADAVVERIVDQLRAEPWLAGTAALIVGEDRLGRRRSMREAIAAVAADATPGVLVLPSMPRGDDGDELARLLDRPGCRWGAVVRRPSPFARWALEARRDGTHLSDVLGLVSWVDIGLHGPRAEREQQAAVATAAMDV